MFLLLPCILGVTFYATNPNRTLTYEDHKEPYEKVILLSITYGKAFEIGLDSVRRFKTFSIYTADRKNGVIRAGNYEKTVLGCMGMIIVTITIEKVAIGSTRVRIHAINPEPFIMNESQGLIGKNEKVAANIAEFIRQNAARENTSPVPENE